MNWPSPQHEAMARNIELDDRSFRSEFGWSPAVNVIEELQNMSSHWSART